MVWCDTLFKYDVMQWWHCRSKILLQVSNQPWQEGEARSWQGQFSIFTKLFATKKSCQLYSFYKIGWNEEELDCPGALPLQQLAERAALSTKARIRKASKHFWPLMRTGGRWPQCFANILSTEKSIKQGPAANLDPSTWNAHCRSSLQQVCQVVR